MMSDESLVRELAEVLEETIKRYHELRGGRPVEYCESALCRRALALIEEARG